MNSECKTFDISHEISCDKTILLVSNISPFDPGHILNWSLSGTIEYFDIYN